MARAVCHNDEYDNPLEEEENLLSQLDGFPQLVRTFYETLAPYFAGIIDPLVCLEFFDCAHCLSFFIFFFSLSPFFFLVFWIPSSTVGNVFSRHHVVAIRDEPERCCWSRNNWEPNRLDGLSFLESCLRSLTPPLFFQFIWLNGYFFFSHRPPFVLLSPPLLSSPFSSILFLSALPHGGHIFCLF